MRTAPVESEYLVNGLKQAGAFVMEEREFILLAHRDKKVLSSDKLVGFFNTGENAKLLFSAVLPQNRWTYAIDTKVKTDGTAAYAGRIAYCREHDINHMIVTYINPNQLRELYNAGINYVGMPHCSPERRKRQVKTQGILMSGTYNTETYPVRTRLMSLFEHSMSDAVKSIATVAQSAKRPTGNAYYDVLDQCQLAVVCKVSNRDQLVAKYVEFGACHVLPVGDCPTYMPDEMKRSMVNIDGMSDEYLVSELRRLLANPAELTARQEVYCAATHRHFDRQDHSHRLVQSILST